MFWPVVPLCKAQLSDVRSEDILSNGMYRRCDTYRGGGGYDQFPFIYERRFGAKLNPIQFVVQLLGCPLKCPYCYVTSEGVYGKPVWVPTYRLLNSYKETGLEVFHLMGGAPALYLEHWKDLADQVTVFHSDFLLVESIYVKEHLENLPGLHVVSFKERYLYTEDQVAMMWPNLTNLVENDVQFYITFTGKDEFSHEIEERFGKAILKDSFIIPIITYSAMSYVQE